MSFSLAQGSQSCGIGLNLFSRRISLEHRAGARARIRAAVGNAAAEMSGISSRYQSTEGVGNLKHPPEGEHPQ